MTFEKILIANRGEIACRIIKTARRMGIATVAVYSTADARASHVEMADEAVHIGPAPAAQSYLVAQHIIEACKQTGAQAVHPGYGFLSEQAGFAEALMQEGIVFIGPDPAAMRAMGDKIESKKFASAAKLSIVPGHLGVVHDPAEAAEIAAGIGYPVMIKASAGGGGKGMRIVGSPAEMTESFLRAHAEAESAFGDDRLLIEKYIANPRHIEIQVLGDKHGNIVHLAERECSIQRRNQKVIEEAPSPLLDESTRNAMGEQAVRLARAVAYDSAGTVEFIASQDRSFYFLEMNTRLQVEHPVTELITGIDLVEEMIRVAAGEPLRIKQEEVTITGWAIEGRVYAEDSYRSFLPSTGRLKKYRPPREASTPSGATIRIDSGVYEGGEISVHYDPLIAKLITHGADRVEATEAMVYALDRFQIGGIRHNIPFLAAIMASEKWRKGQLSTGFIDEEYPQGFKGTALDEKLEARVIAAAVAVHFAEVLRNSRMSPRMSGGPTFPRKILVRLDNEWHPVEINPDTEGLWVLSPHAKTHVYNAWTPGNNIWTGEINGEAVAMQLERAASGYRISHHGATVNAQVYTEQQARLARLIRSKTPAHASRTLRCPMPGIVVSIHVAEGEEVRTGDRLAVIEAMKMQNVLRAERDGKVKRLLAAPGDILAVDAVIMEFETIE
jgi:propionyl-CoA carboxylase alpha chain